MRPSNIQIIAGVATGLVAAGLLVIVVLFGPDRGADPRTDPRTDPQTGFQTKSGTTEAPLPPGERIVATVNGAPVYETQVVAEALAQNVIGDEDQFDLNAEKMAPLVRDLVEQKLLAQEAERRELDRQPEAEPALSLAAERALSELLLRRTVKDQVTEKALEALYEEQVKLVNPEDEIRARHILVNTEDEAFEVVASLEQGKDFVELAKEMSIDGSSANGGDLGYFTKDRMVEAFSTVAFATAVGEISAPFQSQFGWHILKVEDRRKQTLPSFDELRPQLVRYESYRVIQETIDRLRGQAQIDYLLITDPNQ